jgi:DNA-binding response OmpR family regulator
MSKTEDAILARLSVNPGEVVPALELNRLLYEGRDFPPSNVVEVAICRLRKKGHQIKNKRGHGYRLVQNEA